MVELLIHSTHHDTLIEYPSLVKISGLFVVIGICVKCVFNITMYLEQFVGIALIF